MGLESYQIEHGTHLILTAKLNHGIIGFSRFGMSDTHRLHRTEAERILAALGHYFHGHTAFKHGEGSIRFKIVQFCFFCVDEGIVKRLVLFLIHGAVDVIRIALAVTGREKGTAHIDGRKIHDGSGSIKEAETALSCQGNDLFGHGVGGKGTGGDHRNLPLWDLDSFLLHYLNEGAGADLLCDVRSKAKAIHGQRSTGRHAGRIGCLHHKGAHAPQFFLQKAGSGGHLRIAERIRTHQLTEQIRGVGRGLFLRLHLDQADGHTAACCLPGSLTSRKTGTNHVDFFHL